MAETTPMSNTARVSIETLGGRARNALKYAAAPATEGGE
jgi:hypothetical protein